MAYAGFALFLLGVIFIIIAPINKKKNTRCSAQTQGMLMDIRWRGNSKGPTGHWYFYSYCVDGVEYQLKDTVRSPQTKEIGDSCIIWYDPAKPEKAQPFHYDSNKVYDIILIIGIVMFFSGIVLPIISFSK